MKVKNISYLLFGATAGAVMGLLFAPKIGKETRLDIKNWLDEKRKKSSAAVEEFRKNLPDHKARLTEALKKGRSVFKRNSQKLAETVEV